MWIIDLFLSIADFCEDIRWGKRFGFGSVVWGWLWFLCSIATYFLFCFDLYVFAVIGGILAVICFVCTLRRGWQEIKKTRETVGKTES